MKRNDIQVGVEYAIGKANPGSYDPWSQFDSHARAATVIDAGRWVEPRYRRYGEPATREETLADGSTVMTSAQPAASYDKAPGVLARRTDGGIEVIALAKVLRPWGEHSEGVTRERAARASAAVNSAAEKRRVDAEYAAALNRWRDLTGEQREYRGPHRDHSGGLRVSLAEFTALLDLAERGRGD